MLLTREKVEHVAELAKVGLTADEIELYRKQLSAILEYAGRLQQLDTIGIAPTASVLPLHCILRVDEVKPGLSTDAVLRNAPEVEQSQFRVPPVLE